MNSTSSRRPNTLSEVSQMLGVSPSLVSRAFSGKGTLSPERCREITEAARALGYEPNALAQRLAIGRSQDVIAFFSPDMDSGATIFRVQHTQQWFLKHGYDVQLHAKPSYEGSSKSRVDMLRMLRQEKPRALVCNAGWDFGNAELEEVHRFVEEGGEAVCLSYSVAQDTLCDQAVYNSQANYNRIVEHLKALGHTAIGLGGHDTHPDHVCYREFRAALENYNLEFRPQWVFNHPKIYMSEAGARAAASYLELRERPTAMIINADESACAFLNMVQRAGIQVPQELSVVSIDDTPMALYASVALTSASQPCLQHAEKAAELLLERINGTYSGPPRTIWVEGDFKPRDSTAPPPK